MDLSSVLSSFGISVDLESDSKSGLCRIKSTIFFTKGCISFKVYVVKLTLGGGHG